MAENQWRWIGTDGFEYTGNLEKLQAAIREGGVSPTCMVSSAALGGWLPASEVPELAVHEAPLPAFKVEDEAPTMRDNPLPDPPEAPTEPATVRRGPTQRSNAPLVIGLLVLGLFVLGGLGASRSGSPVVPNPCHLRRHPRQRRPRRRRHPAWPGHALRAARG